VLDWLRIAIPSVILLIAIIVGLKLKKQFYLSPYRVLLTVGFIASVFIAVGLGIQLWSFQLMKPFMPAYKGLVQNYLQARNDTMMLMPPDMFLNTTITIISSVDNSSYWSGFARGVLVIAGAVLFIIFLPFKKLFNKPTTQNNPIYSQIKQEQALQQPKSQPMPQPPKPIQKPIENKPVEKSMAMPITEEELKYLQQKEQQIQAQQNVESVQIQNNQEQEVEIEIKEEPKEEIKDNSQKEQKKEVEEEIKKEIVKDEDNDAKEFKKEAKEDIEKLKEEIAELKDAINLLIKQQTKKRTRKR